jgi:glycosyltransferase involved in cell wall biosynthesis
VEAAKKWVSQFTWEKSAELVEAAFVERLTELSFEPRQPAVRQARPYLATVVIPTYNGGDLLHKVVDRILAQRMPGELHLLCIDSSSEDGTNEYLTQHPGVDLVTIDKRDFQHGKTRNLGVEAAKAEFVAFLTQDALPSNDTWLYNLVCVLKNYPIAGGVFGRHIAYDSASTFMQRDIDNHFANFADLPVCIDPGDEWVRNRWSDQTFRQMFHFYSDNNSCLRKSIWREVPIPDLDFGEDQAFAHNLLQQGYGKAYARNAVVYHSHDDPPAITEQRCYEEASFFLQHFGYRFASSELDALRDLHGRNLADEDWAKTNGIDEASLSRRLAQNRARMAGGLKAMRDAGVLPPA